MPYNGLHVVHDEPHDALHDGLHGYLRAEGVPGATQLSSLDTMMGGGSAERVAHRDSSQFMATSSLMWPFDFEIGNSPTEARIANSAKTND
ncbi:hypothetical protein E4U14_004717, partial [Claviceps sp. LM454 group G7]